MLHAQEKLQQTQKPSFFLMPLDIELQKASIDHFFLLTAMIIWFHGTVARTEAKHALFGLSGFLRVSYGLENPRFCFLNLGL
jgi:hypothetical protein